MPHRPRTVLPLTVGCAVLAVAALVATGTMGEWAVAALVGAGVVVTEARPLHFSHGHERRTFTFSEGPLVLGLVLGTGVLLAVGFVIGIAISQLRRRLPPSKVAFNVAQYAAAAAVAVLLSVEVGGTPGVVAGLVAFAVLNDLAVQLVLRLTAGIPLGAPLRGRALAWFLHLAGAASAAILIGQAVASNGALALAFIAPLALVTYSERDAMHQQVAAEVLQTIADQAVASQDRDRTELTSLLTRSARQVLAAREARVVLIEGTTASVVVDHDGLVHQEALAESWQHDDLLSAVLAAGRRGVARGRSTGVVIGPEPAPRAILLVVRDADQEPFRDSDLGPLHVLAEQGDSWLGDAGRTRVGLLAG